MLPIIPAWHSYRLRWASRYRSLPAGVRGNAGNALFVLFLAGILGHGAAFAGYMLAEFDRYGRGSSSAPTPNYGGL